jgi:hypothetical protein
VVVEAEVVAVVPESLLDWAASLLDEADALLDCDATCERYLKRL